MADTRQFFLLDAVDIEFPPEYGTERKNDQANMRDDLYEQLIEDFGYLRRMGKARDEDDYAVVNVGPSVVPNPYLPTFRVYAYNISGTTDKDGLYSEDKVEELKKKKKKKKKGGRNHKHRRGPRKGERFKKCKDAAYQDSWRCHLDEEWHSDAEAPSRSNTLWTPLGYAQVREKG
jgi:endopolyphosphatase